jgi:hypothetical protein
MSKKLISEEFVHLKLALSVLLYVVREYYARASEGISFTQIST